MNLALPALVVFIVLLPGFLARSRLKRVERLSVDYAPFGQAATEAVLWAIALHALWLTLAWLGCGRTLQASVVLPLLTADMAAQSRSVAVVAAQAGRITAYFCSLLAFAYGAPTLARWAITRWRLDRVGHPLASVLRFHGAPWYYLLSGADFSEADVPDLITVSAVVNMAGAPVLFTGVLEDYFLDLDGQLDRLVLQQVMRRPLDKDKTLGEADAGGRFYPVDGDCFVLRYSEAITINIEYIRLQSAD